MNLSDFRVLSGVSLLLLVLAVLFGFATEDSSEPSCSETFAIAMRGATSSSTQANEPRCAAQYAAWLAKTPPTAYRIDGRSLQVEGAVYSLSGMVARRDNSYLRGITDTPQPSVYISQGRHSTVLVFRTKAQADAAFSEISQAIAGRSES